MSSFSWGFQNVVTHFCTKDIGENISFHLLHGLVIFISIFPMGPQHSNVNTLRYLYLHLFTFRISKWHLFLVLPIDIESLQNRLLKVCYMPATSASLPRVSFFYSFLFLLLRPLTVLMKQIRCPQAVYILRSLWFCHPSAILSFEWTFSLYF